MVERAYGNYLGLGRLMAYIASQAGLETGELTVTAGYARLDCRGRLSVLLADSAAADARDASRLSGITGPVKPAAASRRTTRPAPGGAGACPARPAGA